ncbi:MAG: 1-acyl-sn-glycerol-3-phosphate acyltransferase [Cyanobacteria bacterium J06634_6]
MPSFVRQVRPPLEFIPAAYTPWVIRCVHWALPLLLRFRIRPWLPAGISRIEVENVDRLVDLYAQAEVGKAKFLMAPRHVEVDDPLVGLYVCSRAVAKAARQQGIRLKQPVHTHFLYERGMTIWAGRGVGWLLSRIGGSPIRRGRRPDWVGLKAARQLLSEGDMPLVIAPEGATNGHSERIGPLEPGVAQLGFWCAEDLQKSEASSGTSSGASVYILPMGIQYHYERPNWSKLANLLSQLEEKSGLGDRQSLSPDIDRDCLKRILRLGEHLMTVLEAFYDRFYPSSKKHKTTEKAADASQPSIGKDVHEPFDESVPSDCSKRLQKLLEQALQAAESFFNLPGKGNLVERCRRVEEASWQVIYREDLADKTLSSLERGLANWAAEEASLRELHMRIVETFVAADDTYLQQKPSFQRCAEITLLMFDLLARLEGSKLPARPRLGKRWVKVTLQAAIAVTPRLADYQQNRRSGRAAVMALSEEIRQSLEATIER